ncbi:hypothetical protein TWF281_008327 [Arthrobotrys megalospora]
MPVSTRHSAAPAGQQSKLNFTTKKNVPNQKTITHDIVFRASTPPSKAEGGGNDLEKETTKDEEEEPQKPKVDLAPGAAKIDSEQERAEEKVAEGEEGEGEEEGGEEGEGEELPFQEELVERSRFDPSGVDKHYTDKAYKITPRQIQTYYKGIENSRIRSAVHQEGLTEYEKILRHFDLSSQYGPCVGVSRFKRWGRAERLGLEPPIEVLAVLLKSELGEGVEDPPKNWEPAPVATREDVGSVAYINELIATHTE